MDFAEFYGAQKKLMQQERKEGVSGINVDPGTPGFYDLIRLWNGLAMLNPDKCDDVVQVFGTTLSEMKTEPNPFRVKVKRGKERNELPQNSADQAESV